MEERQSMADRLPAEQRKAAIIETSIATFSDGAYGSTTTAQIGKAAGVAETIVFRHFGSKVGLYLACIDAAWDRVRTACEEACANEPDKKLHWAVLGQTFLTLNATEPQNARLWTQALVERTGVAEIDAHLATLMADVHSFVKNIIETSQKAGGVLPARSPSAEAWQTISIGILGSIGQRLGDLVQRDFETILAARREWLTGTASF